MTGICVLNAICANSKGYDYLSAPVPGTAGGGGGGLGLQELDGIHELEPQKFILNTEACTLRSLNQDWKTAALYMVDIIGDLNHWYNHCSNLSFQSVGTKLFSLSSNKFPQSFPHLHSTNDCELFARNRVNGWMFWNSALLEGDKCNTNTPSL